MDTLEQADPQVFAAIQGERDLVKDRQRALGSGVRLGNCVDGEHTEATKSTTIMRAWGSGPDSPASSTTRDPRLEIHDPSPEPRALVQPRGCVVAVVYPGVRTPAAASE